MDAAEDSDLLLQRTSDDLLYELAASVPGFLFKELDKCGGAQLRRSVSHTATHHVIKLLEPFQEWPQLLDTHLGALLSRLTETFLAALDQEQCADNSNDGARSKKVPLTQAICKVIYAFCKIRGPKVICRFMNSEPTHIRVLLQSLEGGSHQSTAVQNGTRPVPQSSTWEEKYVKLLWLSHLLLAPFDLGTIVPATTYHSIDAKELVERAALPSKLPDVALRLARAGQANLHSAGKERDAAVMVLVRLANRADMQRLGLHEALIRWSLYQLRDASREESNLSEYNNIGILTFLARLIKSADPNAIAPYLLHVFDSVRKLNLLHSLRASALSRKAAIDVYSALSITSIRLDRSEESRLRNLSGHVVEDSVGDLLSALADKDTPVRQAASKALSKITLFLERSMAVDVIEAVVSELADNVFWENIPELTSDGSQASQTSTLRQRNLTVVDSLKWHGLVLTLSHLLFRRSPPATQLPSILNCLLLALRFEQRSSLGASLGSNVRDAACFGIWAIARRYSSAELLAIDTSAVHNVRTVGASSSMLQLLALELIGAATLDPSGNIRRGASAALQELIGRHPDMVSNGISIVQIVDYHAVALRSRAMTQVALRVAKQNWIYRRVILAELMTWRGIGAVDDDSRKLAAETVGLLTACESPSCAAETTRELWQSVAALDSSTAAKRHGFLIAMAAVVKATQQLAEKDQPSSQILQRQWSILSDGFFLCERDFSLSTSRPELIAEGACCLMDELARASYGDAAVLNVPKLAILEDCVRYLELALDRKEEKVNQRAASAARSLTDILPPAVRDTWLLKTISKCETQRGTHLTAISGHLLALSRVYSSNLNGISSRSYILRTILDTVKSAVHIDARVAAAKSLTMLDWGFDDNLSGALLPVLQTALQDYTIDQRGDVGSLLRLEAIQVIEAVGKANLLMSLENHETLIKLLTTLAGEKLDKVRLRAWNCLQSFWQLHRTVNEESQIDTEACPDLRDPSKQANEAVGESSEATLPTYFARVMSLFRFSPLKPHLLKALATSVSGGSESVLIASRSALASFTITLKPIQLQAFCECLQDLLRGNLSTERLAVPILQCLAFLLDVGQLQRMETGAFRWRQLYALVRKAHYRTTSIPRLQAAIDVYVGLAQVRSIRREVLVKLGDLLSHPLPKIRNISAESLLTLTQDRCLVPLDWTKPIRETKAIVRDIKAKPSLLLEIA